MATRPAAKKTTRAPTPTKVAAKKAAPAKKVPPKKAAPDTITLKTVFEDIAETQELPRKQAQVILTAMVASITDHFRKGNRIRMSSLGILEVKPREARMGRNPRRGKLYRSRPAKRLLSGRPKS